MNEPVIDINDIKVIDETGVYDVAMRSLGFNFTKVDLERILNMIEIVKSYEGSVTILDTIIINEEVPRIVKVFNDTKESSTNINK